MIAYYHRSDYIVREIRNYKLRYDNQEITNLLNKYLMNKGYEGKSYHNEQVFVFTRIPGISGKLYFKFHISDYALQIEGFIVAFGKEYGIDDNITGAMAKTDLRKEFESIEKYLQPYLNINYPSINNENMIDNNLLNNHTVTNNTAPTLLMNNVTIDRKKEALTALIISLVLIILPLPFILFVVVIVCNIITAIRGLKSSKRWMSILAIVISILELIVIISSFLLKVGGMV